MDEAKKQYLDRYVASRIVPENPDMDLSAILEYFERSPKFLDHRFRFVEAYIRIMRHVRPQRNWVIAETGALSGTSEYMRTLGYQINPVMGDFRSQIQANSDSVDLLISFEVFEHIKDQDAKNFDELVNFNFSGIKTFVAEMYRTVRPGGFLALSTPNPCSLYVLTQVLNYEPPMVFWPHVKEYPPRKVIELCERAGFKVRFWDTMFVFFHLNEQQPRLLKQLFTDQGVSSEHRGDVSFFLFQKPGAPVASDP